MIIKLNVNELMFLWNALDRKNCRSRDEIQKHLHHVRLIQTDKENIQYFLREIPKIPNLEQQQKLKQELDNKVVEVQMTESEKAYMLSILQHFITVNYPKGESQPGIRGIDFLQDYESLCHKLEKKNKSKTTSSKSSECTDTMQKQSSQDLKSSATKTKTAKPNTTK